MSHQVDVTENLTADQPQQLRLFNPRTTTAIRGIRVFDVGQGDCIGLLNQVGRVFGYVDYGGCVDHPDQHIPQRTAERLPVRPELFVILTHWDKDHYYSADKKNPQARACEWLVPRQLVSPSAARFAARLQNAKCWPEGRAQSLERINVGFGYAIEIRKCAAFSSSAPNEDRNRTGLAITLLEVIGEKVCGVMLLPGDCPFHVIPSQPAAPICAMVAYHHGSHVHWTPMTNNAISMKKPGATLIYSCGRNNYGHPDRTRYRPLWDLNAVSTRDLRRENKQSIDVQW